MVLKGLGVFHFLFGVGLLRQAGIAHDVNAAVALVQRLGHLIDEVGVKAPADGVVKVLAVFVAGLGQAHFGKLGMPGALGDFDHIVGGQGQTFRLVGAALLDDFGRVDPLAILTVDLVGQGLAVADGALGHAAAALLGVILRGVHEGQAPSLAKALGQVGVKAGCDKGMHFFIKSHKISPRFFLFPAPRPARLRTGRRMLPSLYRVRAPGARCSLGKGARSAILCATVARRMPDMIHLFYLKRQ